MDVCIYRVKAKYQAVNICVYVMTRQKGQDRKILSLGPQIFMEN